MKKPKPRGGPRTVKRKIQLKIKPAADGLIRVPDGDYVLDGHIVIPPDDVAINTAGPYEQATGLDMPHDGSIPIEPSPPPMPSSFTPQPAPWSCLCGVDRNSALVDECPVCHTKRPYEYTAPEPVLAVPADYPQPGESMEDYAARMKGKTVSTVPRGTAPTDAEMDAEIAEAESASIRPWTTEQREGWKERRLAQFYQDHPVDAGRARELPDPKGLLAKGYACPIQFAGPVGSVDVDPLVLQMALDVANKAAQTGVVQSVTVGLKNPSQARCIVRFDLDVASVPWPRGVRDDG